MTVKGAEAFRALFAEEAEARLSRLGQLVIELEGAVPGTPAALALIGEIFREVHTIKGSAGVVGFDSVGAYAHEVEAYLEELRSARTTCTPEIVDALLAGIDGLAALTWRAVGGDLTAGTGDHPALLQLAVAFSAEPAPVAAPPADPVTPPATAVPGRELPSTIAVPLERLDELIRLVSETAAAHLRNGRMLSERLAVEPASVAGYSELSVLLNQLQDVAMRTRMVPVAGITDQLHRAVRDTARSLGKDVRWEVLGGTTELDRGVLQQLSDALLHLVRNAVDHGVETAAERVAAGKPAQATVRLHAMQLGSEVIIVVTDDGPGIDVERVRQKAAANLGIDSGAMSDDDALQLIFESGLSTSRFVTDISGRGVGLDVVRANVNAARGRVEVRSEPGGGCEFRIVVPVTLAVLRCLLVEVAGQRFAVSMHQIVLARPEATGQEIHTEGRRSLLLDGQSVAICDLAEVLALPSATAAGILVVVNDSAGRYAFRVAEVIGQRDVAVKGLSPLVPPLGVVSGVSVEPDGSILFLLDVPGMIEQARHLLPATGAATTASPVPRHSGRVLVVDDALTVRELQRSILERAGFEVALAGDGVDALSQLAEHVPDLVLTDVEMPRMDGFTLTEQIRARPALANVAVLILTSLASDADRRRGLEAGADGYIVKSAFDEKALLSAVDRVLGGRS